MALPKKIPLLTIVLIGYNSKFYLPYCLKALETQTFKSKEIIFIDNASSDNSATYVHENFKQIRIEANTENIGYAGAANQGIRMTNSKYVMILNPDLVMPPDYLEKIIKKLEQDSKIGGITGKVLKYDFIQKTPSNIFDTTGLYCFRNRRIIDRGQGIEDKGQYDKEEEVFGVSGAVPVYRREALEDIKLPLSSNSDHSQKRFEYLDEDFFMYKEDIDLSWRLRLCGWKCYYYPKAVCYHGRGTGVLKRFTHLEVYKGRRHLSRFQKYYAYKNQRLMQVKNELWSNLGRDFFWIFGKEILIFFYILIREPYLLKALFHFLKQLPSALRKRKLIMQKCSVHATEMAHWLSGSNLS